jgi:glycosyltransferase involved in cell wall biosynthesis
VGKLRVLALAPFPYHARPRSGGELAAQGVLKAIAPDCELFVLTFIRPEQGELTNSALADMRAWAHDVVAVPLVLTKAKILVSHLSRLWGRPQIATLYASERYANQVSGMIDREEIDIILCQFPQMAQYVENTRGVRTVMDVGDAFSVSFWRRFCSQSRSIRKFLTLVDWLWWVRYERSHYRQFDTVLCLTDQDKFGLSLFSPALRAQTIGVPMGEVEMARRPAVVRHTIGFFGSFGHTPNVEAVVWFVECVLALVAATVPHVQFHIAGAGLPLSVTSRLPENTTYHGYVDDLETFLESLDVVVVPLQSGGGVKIKTLQALQHGIPIVTTSIGCEGIDIRDGENALVRDNPEDFAQAVIEVLNDQALASRMSEAAMRQFQEAKSQTDKVVAIKKAIFGE